MTNSRTRTIYHKPRYTQIEAYDLLPRLVKLAMQEGPQQWDSNAVLRHYQRLQGKRVGMSPAEAEEATAKLVMEWTDIEVANGQPWREMEKGRYWRQAAPSPHVQASASLQYSSRDNQNELELLCTQ